VDEKNLPFEPAPRPNTPSGGWPGLCYDHDEVREMEERVIRGVIAETKKHSNVAFYEPMNEPHQWIDYVQNPNGVFCYCEASVNKFRQWLKAKYGDIDALNAAWGYFYHSFDEVRPARWAPSFSDYNDFRLFNMDNVAAEIKFRSDIIRDCDNKPVIAHSWGGGAVTCANLGAMAFDDWKNAKVFDKWGYSAFPMSASDASSLAMGSAATRCAADGKEYWQSELGAGIRGINLGVQGRMDDNTFTGLTLESLRQGARGLLYWQYRKERFGPEFAGYAMTDNAGGPTNLSRCVERIGRAFTENEDIFMNSRIQKSEVALVFSIRSYLAQWDATWKKDNKQCVDSLNGYFRMFWEENIPVDIIHEDQMWDLSAYKMIVLPTSNAISPGLAKRLEKYVAGGGMLISDPYFGMFDECFRLSYEVPGYGFERVFGCRQDDMGVRGGVTLADATDASKTYRLDGNYHTETYRDI
jgi:beta-galactosidase GanA